MDFTQSMDNGYMIPTSVAVGSGEATDIRCVCDTVEDFKTFLDATEMDLRYEGLITYEKVNKLLKVYKGNDTWQTVGEGGESVDTSSFITLTQLSQQLNNYYTKAQTDNKISEEIAKAQLGGSGNVSGSVNLEGFLTNGSSFKKAGTYKNNEVRPIVSFSDDDGSIDVINKWLPIIKDKGISISLPIIPDFIGRENVVTWDNLRELQNEYGCEILSHTIGHAFDKGDPEKTLRSIKKSKEVLMAQGLKVSGLAYPFGTFYVAGEDGSYLCREDFEYAVITQNKVNTYPIADSYKIDRCGIGSYDDNINTLELWKAKVDEAIAKNGWLIFMTHIGDLQQTEEDTENLKLLIDYIKSRNVDIVTIKEGYEIFGNAIETPSTVITNQGTVISTDLSVEVKTASREEAGIIKVGDGLSIKNGVLAVDNSLYYSCEYLNSVIDGFEARIQNLEQNGGGGGSATDSSPVVSSIPTIKASPGVMFDIVYTAVDSDGIFMHEISYDNGESYETISPVGNENEYTYNTKLSDEGSYMCKIKVTDSLGNFTIKSFTIIIETKKIILNHTQGADSGLVSGTTNTYFVNGVGAWNSVSLFDADNKLEVGREYVACYEIVEFNLENDPDIGTPWAPTENTETFNDFKKAREVGVVNKIKFPYRNVANTSTNKLIYFQLPNTVTSGNLKFKFWIEG